jgi:hypothetical protein
MLKTYHLRINLLILLLFIQAFDNLINLQDRIVLDVQNTRHFPCLIESDNLTASMAAANWILQV